MKNIILLVCFLCLAAHGQVNDDEPEIDEASRLADLAAYEKCVQKVDKMGEAMRAKTKKTGNAKIDEKAFKEQMALASSCGKMNYNYVKKYSQDVMGHKLSGNALKATLREMGEN